MLYLSGAINKNMRDDLRAGKIGLLQTPGAGYNLQDVQVWALDNGCYTGKYPGDQAYLTKLDDWEEHKSRCLFVAVPDVIGDHVATLKRWPTMSKRIKDRGWTPALVAQDGTKPTDLPAHLEWLFIGGSTEWKLGDQCRALIRAAQANGTRTHVGRVNSQKRYRRFAELGCDTADGTFIAFGPTINFAHVMRWQREHGRQPTMSDDLTGRDWEEKE